MLHVATKIPTPHGWTTVGDLATGTSVFDEVGYPVFVKSLGPISTEKVYRVGLASKNRERGFVLMTESQLLCTWDRDSLVKFATETGIKSVPSDWAEHEGKNRPLSEIKERVLSPVYGRMQHVIPMTFPIILPHRETPLPPYIMGLVMQLHDPITGVMKCKERMWEWYERQFVNAGLTVERTKKRAPKRPNPNSDVIFSSGELNRILNREHGYNRGLIPVQYLRGSVQQRMELLAGLLDISFDEINTHGDPNLVRGVKNTSAIVWCGKNQQLQQQVLELIRSLGYTAVPTHFKSPYNVETYTVRFSPVENPYRYPKFRVQLPDLTQLKQNTFTRFCWRIRSVEIEDEVPVRSFEVTSPSGLVTVSELFLPVVADEGSQE